MVRKGFTELLRAPQKVWRALKQLDALDFTTVKDLKTLKLYTFGAEDALMEESVRHFWIIIFNAGVGFIEKPNRNERVAHHASKN